jgi:tetratricopeptide (TPR) repeat protein
MLRPLFEMHVNPELTTLEEAGLVHCVETHELEYLFNHILTQETTYATLLRQDRRELHRRIVAACEALYANDLDNHERVAMLAFHCAEAGENAKAVSYLMRFGDKARQLSAYPEAIWAFERAQALMPKGASAQRAQAQLHLGEIYCRRTNWDAAVENFRSALTGAIAVNEPQLAATALSGVARVASQRGEHKQARELGEEALHWAQDSKDREAIARALLQLGIAYSYEGQNEQAEQSLQQSLELFRELDSQDGVASCLNSLGVVARDLRQLDRAETYFNQALELSQRLGDRYGVGIRLVNLGVIAEQRGDYPAATQYQERALALANEIGDREGAALVRLNLGSLAKARGDLSAARAQYLTALRECMTLGSLALALYVIAAIAQLEVARGEAERGAVLLGLAFRHPASTADIRLDFDSFRAELAGRLSPEACAALMQSGSQLDLAAEVQSLLRAEESVHEVVTTKDPG